MPNIHLTVTEQSLCRLVRVGHRVVLAAEVSYPRIDMTDGEPPSRAVARFNEGYRAMAEAFLGWAESVPAGEASEAFASLGVGAAYTFDRRLITCCMRAVTANPDNSRLLVVEREVLCTSRRRSVTEQRISKRDVWRWPELTPAKAARTMKKTRHFKKNSQNLLQ